MRLLPATLAAALTLASCQQAPMPLSAVTADHNLGPLAPGQHASTCITARWDADRPAPGPVTANIALTGADTTDPAPVDITLAAVADCTASPDQTIAVVSGLHLADAPYPVATGWTPAGHEQRTYQLEVAVTDTATPPAASLSLTVDLQIDGQTPANVGWTTTASATQRD